MKKILLFSLLLTVFSGTYAAHIIGGELRYEFVGPGSQPDRKIYKIILLLVKGDATGPNVAQLPASVLVGVFNNDNNQWVNGTIPDGQGNGHLLWQLTMDNPPGILSVPFIGSPCLTNQPTLVYTYATYSTTIELQDNNNGYTIAHQTCCRQINMENVSDNWNGHGMGAAYTCVIPGLLQLQTLFEVDNSPQFSLPVSVICFNSPFTMDFSSTDVDGDSLVYSFCDAYNGGLAENSGYNDAVPPPYGSVTYINGFTSATPLGNLATINTSTGIISGIAPGEGNYVVCVCVQTWRNGRLITTHRKDLLVRVSPCVPTVANPDPGFTTCDGFNIQFNHNSSGANSVFWDFGDPTTDADTSILDNPTYQYTDTGVYFVKFIINKGGNCTDSATIRMAVYPGFFPGFEADAPFCAGQAVQFNDTTFTAYGNVDTWNWNFGNTATLADTSHAQFPQYAYPAAGTYHTSLVVTNSMGCVDTVYKDVIINPLPSVNAPPDTIYCGRDSLQLTATGTANGAYNWLPATNIIGANTATPVVFPTTPTTYFATITLLGCKKTDSIRVTPALDLTNNINANPATICEEDTTLLTGTANHTTHLSWQWSPAASLLTPNSITTKAFPIVTTTYTLQTKWGNHCFATKTLNVPVTPLAIPHAGPDTYICGGQSTTVLHASGGDNYVWTPSAGLSNPNIANPVANPTVTTNYIVHVGVNGCSKKRNDTINVLVRTKPPLTATNDTLICVVDGLQLNATGSGAITWSPNYNISSTTILNPIVHPTHDTVYHIHLQDTYGCQNDDSVIVHVKPKTVINAGPDTSICKTDVIVMPATGDALHYVWSPAIYLSSDSVMNPIATPLVTTTYQVIGNIGTCSDTSEVTITVGPYPPAYAGLDSIVCIGFDAQLFASGGSHYVWSPATYLSNPFIANPVVQNPQSNILYTVTVTDTLGCPKPMQDQVTITVIPELQVHTGADTSLVVGQGINLPASGALNYLWSWTPASLPGWLTTSGVFAYATPHDNITYILQGSDQYGCKGIDSMRITVFDLTESMYVPTAFTPNGDEVNDDIKPIMIGMKQLNYFRIYNRLGEKVFETSEQGKGWDGMYHGQRQHIGSFVWMAEGVTYKGKVITKKGSLVLIR